MKINRNKINIIKKIKSIDFQIKKKITNFTYKMNKKNEKITKMEKIVNKKVNNNFTSLKIFLLNY